jgi:hypothetical protein
MMTPPSPLNSADMPKDPMMSCWTEMPVSKAARRFPPIAFMRRPIGRKLLDEFGRRDPMSPPDMFRWLVQRAFTERF